MSSPKKLTKKETEFRGKGQYTDCILKKGHKEEREKDRKFGENSQRRVKEQVAGKHKRKLRQQERLKTKPDLRLCAETTQKRAVKSAHPSAR